MLLVSSLNLCLKMPDLMQKESAHSDHLGQRNVQNVSTVWDIWTLVHNIQMGPHIGCFLRTR